VDRKERVNVRTGKKYRSIVKKLEQYGGNVQFQDLTVTWLKEYSDWMADARKNTPNTIHTNLRAIRAILYEAIREDLFPAENNPFFKFKLKTPKVSRVKLNPDEIKAFANVQPEGGSIQQLSKDLFLFSFFSYGMRFSDVVQLRWKNIEGEYIRYQMGKTENFQSVKVFPPAKAIIDKYRDEPAPDDYIFTLLNTEKNLADPGTLAQEITMQNGYVNKQLDELRKKAGINKHITFHTARHSFADIARKKGTDLHSISTSLGHQSLKTTQNYLAALDNETTDNAVRTVYEEFDNE
jgi:integrase